MDKLTQKIRNIHYSNEKIRFLVFAVGLFLILFLARYLLSLAYSRYEVRTKITANIDKALYIFEDDHLSFNLEPEGIIPSSEPYVYRFSVSNYNASKHSDVDLSYTVRIRSTTNLPITISVYRNEDYTDTGATTIFNNVQNLQDEDDAWYRVYKCTNSGNECSYNMLYTNDVTDVYTMVISFPSVYAVDTTYANYIENIEVTLDSKQII